MNTQKPKQRSSTFLKKLSKKLGDFKITTPRASEYDCVTHENFSPLVLEGIDDDSAGDDEDSLSVITFETISINTESQTNLNSYPDKIKHTSINSANTDKESASQQSINHAYHSDDDLDNAHIRLHPNIQGTIRSKTAPKQSTGQEFFPRNRGEKPQSPTTSKKAGRPSRHLKHDAEMVSIELNTHSDKQSIEPSHHPKTCGERLCARLGF